MSLLAALWRYKVASALVILATLGGAGAALYLVPPTYSGVASYLLIEPPEPPTALEVERDPALARVHAENPYVRYGDTSVIINVVSRLVASKETQEAAASVGPGVAYEVTPSRRFGVASPIIDISAKGSSPESVSRMIEFLDGEVQRQLLEVQRAESVDPTYMFTLRQVDYPDDITTEVSSKIRLVVGICGLGGIVLLLLLAGLRSRARMRLAAEQAAAAPPLPPAPPVEPPPVHRADDPATAGRRRWSRRTGHPARREDRVLDAAR